MIFLLLGHPKKINEAKPELSNLGPFPTSMVFICISIWEDSADKFKGNVGLKLTLVLFYLF